MTNRFVRLPNGRFTVALPRHRVAALRIRQRVPLDPPAPAPTPRWPVVPTVRRKVVDS